MFNTDFARNNEYQNMQPMDMLTQKLETEYKKQEYGTHSELLVWDCVYRYSRSSKTTLKIEK
jgi:hypothetical protein